MFRWHRCKFYSWKWWNIHFLNCFQAIQSNLNHIRNDDCNNVHNFSYLCVYCVWAVWSYVLVRHKRIDWTKAKNNNNNQCLCITDRNWINKSNDAIYATFTNAEYFLSLLFLFSRFTFTLRCITHTIWIQLRGISEHVIAFVWASLNKD